MPSRSGLSLSILSCFPRLFHRSMTDLTLSSKAASKLVSVRLCLPSCANVSRTTFLAAAPLCSVHMASITGPDPRRFFFSLIIPKHCLFCCDLLFVVRETAGIYVFSCCHMPFLPNGKETAKMAQCKLLACTLCLMFCFLLWLSASY